MSTNEQTQTQQTPPAPNLGVERIEDDEDFDTRCTNGYRCEKQAGHAGRCNR